MRNVDTVHLGSYKTRPSQLRGRSAVAALVAAAVVGWAGRARASNTVAFGLPLPSGSTEVGENRYRSGSNYEDTIKFFTTNYKGLPRKPIANQPGIRAVHFDSMEAASGWEGFNVYEKGGETRIFILPRAGNAEPTEEKPEKKKRHKKEKDP